MPSNTELSDLTSTEAVRLIENRKLSLVELTDAPIARTEALKPQIDAYMTTTFDTARNAARFAESEIMRAGFNLLAPITVELIVVAPAALARDPAQDEDVSSMRDID